MKKTTNKTLLVLGGLLLIIVGISSGCIGGNGDGGTDSDVTGASDTGVQQPETKTEVKKPLLPKAVRGLTPGETVEAFCMALKEERYTDATEYLTAKSVESMMSVMQQFQPENPPKSIEEALFRMVSIGWSASVINPLYDDSRIEAIAIEWTSIEQIEILNEKYSTIERWSDEHKKPIEYQTATVFYRVILPEDSKEELREKWRKEIEWIVMKYPGHDERESMLEFEEALEDVEQDAHELELIKIDGVWKIIFAG